MQGFCSTQQGSFIECPQCMPDHLKVFICKRGALHGPCSFSCLPWTNSPPGGQRDPLTMEQEPFAAVTSLLKSPEWSSSQPPLRTASKVPSVASNNLPPRAELNTYPFGYDSQAVPLANMAQL